MSKQLFVDPKFLRAPGKIEFTDIPVNQYNKTIEDEKKNFKKDGDLCLLWHNTSFTPDTYHKSLYVKVLGCI